MPGPATLSAAGQWTLLATDLTTIRDTAQSGTGATTGQLASTIRTPRIALPPLNGNDFLFGNLPGEILAFIQLAAQGFGASFFNNGAINLATPTAQLDVIATALLVRKFLDAYLGKGLPGHDGIGSRAI
jgi:hypothetical protein